MECCPDQVRHAHGTGEFAGIILNTSALLLVSLLKAAG
jgi:hypothetical protein